MLEEGCAGKKEAGSENQRDAVLGALEPDKRDRGEHKSENTRGDLKVALQDRIGPQRDFAQPVGGQENQQETRCVQQDALELAPFKNVGNIAHVAARFKPAQP
jgi:hypothetical protein